jgi:hypothetical protein
MQRLSLPLSTLVAMMAAACTADGQPVPLEDLSEAVSTVYCDRIFECYDAAERADLLEADAQPDEAQCAQVYTVELDEVLEPSYREVAAGRMRYDGDAATSCLSDIAGASCGAIRIGFDYVGQRCRDAFVSATP